MKPIHALFLFCVLTAGCSSGNSGGGSSSSSSSSRSAGGPLAFQNFPPERQAWMKEGLHQLSKGDPRWEQTRATWVAMGQDEADFLVQLMWAALLSGQAVNEQSIVVRARHELAKIGEPSVPLLAEFLEGGTVYTTTDEATGERRDIPVDDTARREASEILGVIGAPAVPAVRTALDRTGSKAGRRYALETLGFIGDRGGAAAYEPILAYTRSDDEVMRVSAVFALRYFHDDTTKSALIGALNDSDELVRRKAAAALLNRRETSSVSYIRAAADRARGNGKLAEASELDNAAKRIEHPGK